jgi:DNA-binding NtrC family response regulator
VIGRILLVDDEKLTRLTLEVELKDNDYEVFTAANPYEALAILERQEIDVVLTDVRMPSMDGLEFQRVARDKWPDTVIVFMTAFGTVASAVEAMREGAADYLTKPLHTEELLIRLQRLSQIRRHREQYRRLLADAADHGKVGDLVYRSSVMAAVVERALSVASTDMTVLIEGETGTGKEVLSRVIHDHSQRSAGPFVPINCAGLNPNLVESELFGHEAGAFTGAVRQRRGRFESAAGGTVLIDEVDDLPAEIQVRLLRFLQDHTFERVGGNKMLTGDVRVLCATKRSLPDLVREGRFREDLYFRINAVCLQLPPLRSRREDILPLAELFAKRFWKSRGYTTAPEISADVLRTLVAHDWPGNVRELAHAIEHGAMFSHGAPIAPQHLPPSVGAAGKSELVELKLEGLDAVSYTDIVASCERKLIDWALGRTGGNQARAAELLKLSRTTLRGRIAAVRGQGPIEPGDATGK